MAKQRREWAIYNEQTRNNFVQHQTEISQLSDRITLTAGTISSLDGKVEEYYSELVVADQGITSTVATKVGADSIISTINQSSEAVTIDASKINLNGFVTFTNLAAYGDHTIALGDGSNTLTIDGSTIVGTNSAGWIGYKLKPSALDIYSFTSNNDLVGRLAATKSSQMGNSDVGVALYADAGDWLTLGRLNSSTGNINAVLWNDPSNNATYLSHAGGSYADISLNSTQNIFGRNGKSVFIAGGGYTIASATTSGAWFGNENLPTYIHGSTASVTAGSAVYVAGTEGYFRTTDTKTGFRFVTDSNGRKLYVFNDYYSSTYMVFEGSSVNIYATNGKVQLYGPGNRSLYFGSTGLMYTGTDGTPHYIQTTAGNAT